MAQKRVCVDGAHGGIVQSSPAQQVNVLTPPKESIPAKVNDLDPKARFKLNNIDLNSVYDDSEEGVENMESPDGPVNVGTGSPGCSLGADKDSNRSSPPQESGNSGSTSTKSPSNCSIENQVFWSMLLLFLCEQ